MVIPFLTVYLTGRGHTLTEAGIIMSCFGVGAILGGYLGGQLTDKFHFLSVQVASLLLNGVLFIVLGYMQTLLQIGLCVFVLSSLGEAFRPANAAAIAAYSNDYNRTRCYSLNRLAINLGWAIGPALGGLLASINYKLLFWVDGVTCMLAALLLFLVLSPHTKEASVSTTSENISVGSVYKDKVFLKGMFFLLIIGFVFFQMFSMIPVFYKEKVHLSEALIGMVLAANGLIIALVEMVLVYKLEKHNKGMLYMIYGTLLIGISFLFLAIAPIFALVAISMLVITVGEMLLFPFTNDFWVSRTNHSNRGQYAAVYTMTFAVGQVLAPLLASRIAIGLGFTGLFIIDFGLCGLAALGFFWLKKQMNADGKI